MKHTFLLSIMMLCIAITGYSTKWTVTNSGNTFTPATITIVQGDSVFFNIASIHDALEVSQATWNANGNTALPGGFSTPFGGGLVLPSALTPGTHYYVCQPHASGGMKGTIIVNLATGITDKDFPVTLSLFPNPAQNILNITSSAETLGKKYTIIDMHGRTAMSGTIQNEYQSVEISPLSYGIYLFQYGEMRRQNTVPFIKN